MRSKDLGDTKLIVENDTSQVKIEVNVVFRGTVLPVERQPLSARTGDLFGVEFEAPILARDELYAGKLVAALDRQHPRDLFDVWQLYESAALLAELPALRWKLANLEAFRKRRPADFEAQANALDSGLGQV